MSAEAKAKIKQEAVKQQLRRKNEKTFEETGDPELNVVNYDDDEPIIVGRKNTVAESEIPGVYKRMGKF